MITLTIDQHYCGPSQSGNGGYSAGLIAEKLPFSTQITLRQPPPLNKAMQLIIRDNQAQLLDDTRLIAGAKPYQFTLDIPSPVSLEQAVTAEKLFLGYQHSPFPNCFVCGDHRKVGQGLKIHPGKVSHQIVAAPWTPYANLADEKGHVRMPFIWAALDCPGAWAFLELEEVMVLGRFAVQQVQPIYYDRPYVVMGWGIRREGRKSFSGTAIFDNRQVLCAVAEATWITLV